MKYPRQEKLQRTLMFEPQPRVSLPEAARQECGGRSGGADCCGDGRHRSGRVRRRHG